jgi:parallel beta-helix repeat protein
LLIVQSSGNTINDNIVSRNNYQGIQVTEFSGFNLIINNTIVQNSGYGLYCDGDTSNNRIYRNIIVENEVNACDDGRSNKWNSTKIGNYWSDYNGTGVYYIPGRGNSIDYKPISNLPIPTSTLSTTISTSESSNPSDNTVLTIYLFIGVGVMSVALIVIFLFRQSKN